MTSETPTPVSPQPQRRFGIGALLFVAFLSAGGAGAGVFFLSHRHGESGGEAAQPAKEKYQCPMHPGVVQDHPGDCPICGMKLVKIEGGAPDKVAAAQVAPAKYQCPMHPGVVQDHPGDCPICGMKLVKVDGGAGDKGAGQAQAAKYQCPMHPGVVQDHPGDCPICGMKLVKVETTAKPGERKISFYRSPMDPKVTSHEPKKDEMGMDYVPVYEDEVLGGGSLPGLSAVTIDAARQQLIGLKTAPVTTGEVGGAWRTTGKVAVDETKVRHINLKVSGYVEKVYVDFVGKQVRKGEPIFSMYSPELLSAQEEYLLALRTRADLAKAGGIAADGDTLVAAARRKLQLWDISEKEVEEIAKTGQPMKALTIYSPVTGVVTKKDAVEGMKLDAGSMPYELVDLSSVWVLADVYESELRFVKEGMAATLTLNAYPDRHFKGKVVFIDPMLDPKTRTVKVRLTFPNATGELRPEMFGEVVLQGTPRKGLSIPSDAVIDSGTAKIVFVALGEGKFEPRRIKLGDDNGDRVEVVSGLSEGDQVVTRANFLIDSESRLRASLAELTAASQAAPAQQQPESARVVPGATAAPAPTPSPATPTAMPAGMQMGHDAGEHGGHGGHAQ